MMGLFRNTMPDSYLHTSVGGREVNEDTAVLKEVGNHRVLALVADGLGGHGGGAIASAAAAELIKELAGSEKTISIDALERWVSEANQKVLSLQTKECAMKTTLVFLLLWKGMAVWAHVGDSRLYHFTDGVLTEQTIDHSVTQMAVYRGEITPDEIRFHEDRNRLLRAVGREGELRPDVSELLPLKGHRHSFLLCSDGFWEYVWENEMERCLAESESAKDWVNRMLAIHRERVRSGNDNHTVVAIKSC